ncbi:MAG: 50S ribosomal protein L7/L12 [Candidatus Babeliaceae bacterium]
MATKIEQLLSEIKGLNLIESAELAKALEEAFGVTASMAAAPAAGAQEASVAAPKAEEKEAWTVKLTATGANKIEAVKALRKVKKDLGLMEAKKAVEEAPTIIAEGVSKAEAEEMKKTLEAAGATVELS